MRAIYLIFSAILFTGCTDPGGKVNVYSYPETIVNTNHSEISRSSLVEIEVEQGRESYRTYVMFDKNQASEGNLALNPDNHWTNFSMSGTVRVKVTRLDGKDISFCNILPSKKGIKALFSGKTATFEVSEEQLPLQVYVEMNDMADDAVLIFADPLETDIPPRKGPDVEMVLTTDDVATVRNKLTGNSTYVVFEEGIHQWGDETGMEYAGYKLPLESGKKIYIPGGAYVVGTFSGSPSDCKIYGRGVISLAGKDMLGGTKGIPYSTVMSNGDGTGQVLEGFVSICPPHFHLTVRGEVKIENVKMMSWWHSTDGTVTGPDSEVLDCFFKVNDDFIKVYSDNCHHENNTMFHQVNGAPFQLSWGNQQARNCTMVNTYIVNSVYKNMGATGNTAVINARKGAPGKASEDLEWDGLFIDNGCHRLIGLEPMGGVYRNFEIRNVEINTGTKSYPQKMWSYFEGDTIANINFTDLKIDGYKITGTDPDADKPSEGLVWFRGDKSAITFR